MNSPRNRVTRFPVSTIGILAITSAVTGCSISGSSESDWAHHGLDEAETRYSPLEQINKETISRLGLAWSLDLPDENDLEATPLEVDGTLYFPGGMGKVYAASVESGKLLWSYDPEAGPKITDSRRMGLPVNRGVAYDKGSVYVATRDGRMISIDAKTGKPRWSTQFLLPDDGTTSTGAPRVCGSNVIIGNAGAESLSRGYVTAMNMKTGKIAWRFFIVPGNPAVAKDETTKIAAKTWSGEWWKYGGGGNPWNGMTCDRELGQFLIGTGNAAPYALEMRSKGIQDNLFVDSMVAVDAETGKYRWHYQYNPGEEWDWKATQDITLTDMEIDGKKHKVALQAPSNGFFYVIDRTNGKLLAAKDYGKQNWAKYIDLKTGRPVETGNARYSEEPKVVYPGPLGVHNWQAWAVNTDKQVAYIPAFQIGATYALDKKEMDAVKDRKHAGFTPSGIINGLPPETDDPRDNKMSLIAWDIPAQKILWRVDHPSHWNSGVMTTKGGLVFQGLENGHLVAYDDANGKKLWDFDAKHGIMAPPITYSYKGKQYVSVLAGYGGSGGYGLGVARTAGWVWGQQPRRLLTFALDAKAKLPETPPHEGLDSATPILVPGLKLDDKKIALGRDVYNYSCSYCHFAAGLGAGAAPDLRASAIAADKDAFAQIMKDGPFVSRGMPKFADLSPEEVEGLYQYIRYSAVKTSEAKKQIRAR